MKRLIFIILLTLFTVPVFAKWTIVSHSGEVLRVMRDGDSLHEFIKGRYAPIKYRQGSGRIAVEREDSVTYVTDPGNTTDTVIFYTADSLISELDTVSIESAYMARLIIEDSVRSITGKTLILSDGTVIILP